MLITIIRSEGIMDKHKSVNVFIHRGSYNILIFFLSSYLPFFLCLIPSRCPAYCDGVQLDRTNLEHNMMIQNDLKCVGESHSFQADNLAPMPFPYSKTICEAMRLEILYLPNCTMLPFIGMPNGIYSYF